MFDTGPGNRALKRIGAIAAVTAGMLLMVLPAQAGAVQAGSPWLGLKFLNIAHQGGEDEVPTATMYALKTAMTGGGADMLEFDVQLSQDGELVVLHDDTYSRTACTAALCPDATNDEERPDTQVRDMTLAEIQALDAAYWFRKPGSGPASYGRNYAAPASDFPMRGIRTGEVPPPPGYTADDFRIPTLKEVLDTFPTTPINIEIKMPKSPDPARPYDPSCSAPEGPQVCDDLDLQRPTTQALATMLNRPEYSSRRDIIVVSFAQEAVAEFAELAPQIMRAPGASGLANYAFFNQPLSPDVAAFQAPPVQAGFAVPELLLQNKQAHQNGYAVHIFTDGAQDETPAQYQRLYNLGVDGIMTSRPRQMHAWACAAGIRRPNGSARCPQQDVKAFVPIEDPPVKKCKKGQKLKKGKCVKKKPKKKKKGKK